MEPNFCGWTFALKEGNLDGVLRVKGENSMKSIAISVNVWFILLGSVVSSTAIESFHQHSCCVMNLHFHTMYVHCQKVLLPHPHKNGTDVLIEQPAASFEIKLNWKFCQWKATGAAWTNVQKYFLWWCIVGKPVQFGLISCPKKN